MDERERDRLERWGALDPIEPIMPPDMGQYQEPRATPAHLRPEAMRLALARGRTEHNDPLEPRCPRCRRPYNPDARLQAGIAAGFCYQCAPLDRASIAMAGE